MIKYCIKRVLSIIPVLFVISVLLFGISKAMPGDPVVHMIQGVKAEQYDQQYAYWEERLGLDKSLPEQYVAWISNLAQGELGFSTSYNKQVVSVIKDPLVNTIALNVFVLFFSLSISIYAGIQCAVKKGTFVDRFWQVFSLTGRSVPAFFVSMCLIYLFAIKLGWFPIGGMPMQLDGFNLLEWLRYLVLPVTTLTLISLAGTIQYVRNSMLESINQDYIRTARSKGLTEKVVIYSHAFRNALIPVITIVISSIGTLFTGSMITESVFGWEGLGTVLIKALNSRDAMLIIVMNFFYAFIYILTNFIADLLYAVVDPRIKLD